MGTTVAVRERGKQPVLARLRERFFPEGKGSLVRYLALLGVVVLAIISLFPTYWAVITSFKLPKDVATIPPSFVLTRPSLGNYKDLFAGTGVVNAPVGRWFGNSVIVSVSATVGALFVTSLAGYTFARLEFPGRGIMFAATIATMLVPAWSTIIATYALTKQMGLHDTLWALILLGIPSPFGVFLFRQFALTLPDELFQAARIDGASEVGLWWRIAMPLCRPVIATLGIFNLVWNWNDFLWPLLVLNKIQLFTVPVGVNLLMYQIRQGGPMYGIGMAAAILMSALPIIGFILMQRQMIKGITLGGIKG